MKKCLLAILGLSASLFFMNGCADDQARAQIADTNLRLNQLQQSMGIVNNKLNNQKTLDLLNQISDLQNQISQLSDKINSLEQKQNANFESTNQSLQSLDLRISSLEGGRTQQNSHTRLNANNDTSKLNNAIKKIKNNQITSAIQDLKNIINNANSSIELKANANYYLSVAYLASGDYNQAIKISDTFIAKYHNSLHVPDAMRVVFISQTQLGNRNAAKNTARRLIKSYPKSEAARKVKEQLN